MEHLLEDTAESFYWIGFILADGHIGPKMRLNIGLSIKDIEHLKKLAKFINVPEDTIRIKEYTKSCHFSKMATEILTNVVEKFKIESNKTENPPDFSSYNFNDDLIFSLIIGFIDGDGCINHALSKRKKRNEVRYRDSAKLGIKNHSSWYYNHLYMSKIIGGQVKINTQGYSKLSITEHEILKNIKQRAISLQLPLLERKWNEIDLTIKTRVEKAKENKKRVKILIEQNKSYDEIAKELNMSKNTIYGYIRKREV